MADINIDGLFVNADSGFDPKEFRDICKEHGLIANIDFNSRNGEVNDSDLLDELLYKERYSMKGQTLGWILSGLY